MRLVALACWRTLRHQPWQAWLATLGVALGVAVVVGIDLTEASARRSFSAATGAVLGRASHQILGGPSGVDERAYAALRRAGSAARTTPVVQGSVALPRHGEGWIGLLGIDPLSDGEIRTDWRTQETGADLGSVMRRPDAALLTRAAAARLSLTRGDVLRVAAPSGTRDLEVVGLLDGMRGAPLLGALEMIVVDIATAQELLARRGQLSRIDVVARSEPQRAALEALLDPGLTIVPTEARSEATLALTRAFYTNLRALGLLALLVGAFLVYSAASFLVIQRYPTLATLRALGAPRAAIVAAIATESLAMGALGSVVGIGLGIGLAHGLLALVTTTLNDLYFSAAPQLRLEAVSLAKALALGLGVSVIAGLIPTGMALRRSPHRGQQLSALESTARRRIGRAGYAGVLLIGVGVGVLAIPGSVVTGFAGLFLAMLGYAIATPALCDVAITRLGRPRHWLARVSAANLRMTLGRSAVAIAALSLAFSASLGIALMIGSFRIAVDAWLTQLLRADYYLVAQGPEGGGSDMPITLAAEIERQPGVRLVSHARRVRLTEHDGDHALVAYQLNERARSGFRLLTTQEPRLWERIETEDRVLVSEPYARRHRLEPGALVTLRTDQGPRDFVVAAVYQDYGSEHGAIAIARAIYDRHWRDPNVSGIGLYVGSDFELPRLRAWLQETHPHLPLQLQANAEIRALSLAVFDRTFAVTEVLRLIAALIAVIGLLSALLAIELARGRNFAVLMALGCDSAAIRRVALLETGMVGVLAGLCALPAGIGLAAALVQVINVRSFGWRMDLVIAPDLLLQALLAATLAATLAGVYPALRLSRQAPAAALRTE